MNNEKMKDKWDRAFETGERVPIGREVVCDICNKDYTESDEKGGFIFGTYAYCPKCAEDTLPRIKENGEEEYIRATCLSDQSFADFVRKYRGPNAVIHVTSLRSLGSGKVMR